MSIQTVVSGIQPTGLIHLGNYLGAVKNWRLLQDQYNSIFIVADMHAITSCYFKVNSGLEIAKELKNSSAMTAATLKACGIRNIFIQSQVPEHAMLMWIFSCISPMSWFQKMTNFKEKKSALDGASLGIFAYPALMASDILLYKGNLVPVGHDQTQHIELAVDIAQRFNSLFGEFFPIPQPLFTKAMRVMSLRDSSAKMSKSSKSDFSRINLLDSVEILRQKVVKAKTDSILEVYYDENRPELANLMRIFAEVSNKTPQELVEEFRWKDISEFKSHLTEVLIEEIRPIRDKTLEILASGELDLELKEGLEKARAAASENLKEIKKMVGFV